MKTTKVLFIITCLIICLTGFAQLDQAHDELKKRDNIIGLFSTDEFDIAIEKLDHSLKIFDFQIGDVDPYKKTFLTDWANPFANRNFRMRIVGSYMEITDHERIKTIITLVGIVEQYIYLSEVIQTNKIYYCEYKENGTHIKNAGFRIMDQIAKYHGGGNSLCKKRDY